MTSKRNSRAFVQDESERDSCHQHQHQQSSTASYRTRSSRNASNEDLRSNKSEEDDSKSNGSMEKREKTVVMRCPTGPVTAKDMTLSATGEVTGESIQTPLFDATVLTIAKSRL